MKSKTTYEVVRATLPALAGVCVLALAWGVHCLAWRHFAARIWVADWYQAIGVNPTSFWNNSHVFATFSDWNAFIIWVSACIFFALGPFVAFLLSKSRASHIFSAALLLAVITRGCLDVVFMCVEFYEFYAIANLPLNFVRVAQSALFGSAWIFALSLGGAVVGIALQRLARAKLLRLDPPGLTTK